MFFIRHATEACPKLSPVHAHVPKLIELLWFVFFKIMDPNFHILVTVQDTTPKALLPMAPDTGYSILKQG